MQTSQLVLRAVLLFYTLDEIVKIQIIYQVEILYSDSFLNFNRCVCYGLFNYVKYKKEFIMATEEIIAKANSEDNEDLYFELKESRKYKNEFGSFTLDSLLQQVVAFANREGGRLIVGIRNAEALTAQAFFSAAISTSHTKLLMNSKAL